jgi:putative aldouronate transport system substrate-binding protein
MRKLLVVLLALSFVFGMVAACGGDDSGTPTTPGSPTNPANPANPTAPGAPGGATRDFVPPPDGNWDVPYDRPVKILAVAPHGSNWYFQDGDDINNNPWTRLYKDLLNIEVEFEWTAIDEYETRLNMAIAAGNLPDVFTLPWDIDPRLFSQLQSEGMLLDLTDAYNNHISQRIRNHELVDPYTIQGYTVDGRIYGIPRYYYGQIDQPWHMWVRKDWYEAAGSPEIRTVADLEELARTFMRDQGAAYGIAVDDNMQWLFRTAPMWDSYVGNIHNNEYFWRADSTGRLKPGIAFPEFQTALENWQRWYAEGLISPEFMTMEEWGRGKEDILNGRVGIQCWWQWWGWYSGPDIVAAQNDNAYFIPLNLPTVSGNRPANGQIFYPNTGVTVASANFQNPAALMKVLSLVDHMVFSPDAGLTPEQIEYFMDEGREHAMSAVFQIIDPHADLLQFQNVLRALNTGDESQLFTTGMQFKYKDSLAWRDNKEPHGLGAYLQMGFEGSAYGRSQHLFDNNWTIQTAMWGPPPTEFAAAGSTGDIIMEEVMNIIMGNRPVSDWPSILQQWYTQGGQIKEDAVNVYYR